MSNFWSSRTGNPITGDSSKAFTPEFGIIPNNTTALAKIVKFERVTKSSEYGEDDFYQITWKLADGEFENREVSQKIKVFIGSDEQIDRALNMLKLVMDLCNFKPKHSNEPTNDDLKPMIGSVLGIKIREWRMPDKIKGGHIEGNFVSEVHPKESFITVSGTPLEHKQKSSVDSALTRNATTKLGVDFVDDDVPF